MSLKDKNAFNQSRFIKVILAAVKIEIECNYYNNLIEFKDYLADFETPDIIIRINREDLNNEQGIFSGVSNDSIDINDINFARYASTLHYMNIEAFLIHRMIADKMIDHNTILMHGSVVAKDDLAYMFTAPSGTGKSTRTQLWINTYPDSFVVNGDKPLIKLTENKVIACGTPWCGKEGWNTNAMVNLHTIFLLERADNENSTTIERVSFEKAFPMLLKQCYCPKEFTALFKTISLLKRMNGKVTFYIFRSKPNEEAIKIAYETAKPQ